MSETERRTAPCGCWYQERVQFSICEWHQKFMTWAYPNLAIQDRGHRTAYQKGLDDARRVSP